MKFYLIPNRLFWVVLIALVLLVAVAPAFAQDDVLVTNTPAFAEPVVTVEPPVVDVPVEEPPAPDPNIDDVVLMALLAAAATVNRVVEFAKPKVRMTRFSPAMQETILVGLQFGAGILAALWGGGALDVFEGDPRIPQTFALMVTGGVIALGSEGVHVFIDLLRAGKAFMTPASTQNKSSLLIQKFDESVVPGVTPEAAVMSAQEARDKYGLN